MPAGSQLHVVPWEDGTTEVALLAVIFGVFIGVPLLLFSSAVRSSPTLVFYLFLWMLGVFGHIDDVKAERLARIKGASVAKAVLVGIIVFVVLELMFSLNLSLLETTPASLTTLEALWFNMSFVIVGEELVFRDTCPYYLTVLLKRGTHDEVSATIIATLISAVAFGTFHVVAYQFDYISVAKAIVAGVLLGLARDFAGLLSSYIAHFLFNIINLLGILTLMAFVPGSAAVTVAVVMMSIGSLLVMNPRIFARRHNIFKIQN